MTDELRANPESLAALAQATLSVSAGVRKGGDSVRGISLPASAFGNLTAAAKLADGHRDAQGDAVRAVSDVADRVADSAGAVLTTAFVYQTTDVDNGADISATQ
ncbi:excreted virulence factor EspC (type VII ESX diderm) [Stackebrandtia albiflava]|uniref:Excreted virulence factor EspC (Type VII ESX diderm) n=1 Tax=Stackebrandtia albiflava TaxID=406432 RepID=A0A562V342_9ACTN|nr:type VII secretion target [Stackebrandtia albiflava]TWJ12227.1 excreted virulence factor EspC (type VII ESX diderm) [Stackebrandtia albiflava]